MPEADKVGLETFGLGTSAKGHRVIVTFPRYLSSMSSRHQQHWDSYRVRGCDFRLPSTRLETR